MVEPVEESYYPGSSEDQVRRIRQDALYMVASMFRDNDGYTTADADDFIEAAKKIEEYIKGENNAQE